MKKVRIGFIGAGWWATTNHIPLLAQHPDVELVGVCRLGNEMLQTIKEKFGFPFATEDYRELLQQGLDGVVVTSPHHVHYEHARAALEAGCHVMVEKPISESYAEAQAMIELAQEKNVILQVGHIERFNPVLRQLEERMNQPRFIEAHRLSPFPNRSMDIGVVLDVMIHDIEIVLHLVKSPLVQVDAVGINVLTNREDIANARLKFANGCIANITASRISPEKMRKIRVFQQDSYLSLDYQEQSGWIYRKDGMQIVREAVEVEKDEPLKLEIAAFVECARLGKRPVVTGQEGAEAVRIALEITDQIERNAKLAS